MILLVSMLFCGQATSEEVTELSIGAGDCWLKERGVLSKEQAISITGKKTENGCIAFIQDNEFKNRFAFCVYSGFEMAAAEEAAYYGCSISREKDSFMFRAYMSYENLKRAPSLICKFMCYNK